MRWHAALCLDVVVITTRIVSVNSRAPPTVPAEASAALSTAVLPAAWRETCNAPVKVKRLLLCFSASLISCFASAVEALGQWAGATSAKCEENVWKMKLPVDVIDQQQSKVQEEEEIRPCFSWGKLDWGREDWQEGATLGGTPRLKSFAAFPAEYLVTVLLKTSGSSLN